MSRLSLISQKALQNFKQEIRFHGQPPNKNTQTASEYLKTKHHWKNVEHAAANVIRELWKDYATSYTECGSQDDSIDESPFSDLQEWEEIYWRWSIRNRKKRNLCENKKSE